MTVFLRDFVLTGGSGSGTAFFGTAGRGVIAEARPAEVFGGARSSSVPETAPARMGWVWPP